jgi:hypothetical protein
MKMPVTIKITTNQYTVFITSMQYALPNTSYISIFIKKQNKIVAQYNFSKCYDDYSIKINYRVMKYQFINILLLENIVEIKGDTVCIQNHILLQLI